MKLFVITAGLLLTWMSAYAASPDFTIPIVAEQPVVVVQVRSDEKTTHGDTIVTIENRSSKSVKDVWLVLAGHSCKSTPVWPISRYSEGSGNKSRSGRPHIEPGGRAEIRLTKKLVREIGLVAEKTCGRKLPSELAITEVDFADGSHWTLGEAVKRGDHR